MQQLSVMEFLRAGGCLRFNRYVICVTNLNTLEPQIAAYHTGYALETKMFPMHEQGLRNTFAFLAQFAEKLAARYRHDALLTETQQKQQADASNAIAAKFKAMAGETSDVGKVITVQESYPLIGYKGEVVGTVETYRCSASKPNFSNIPKKEVPTETVFEAIETVHRLVRLKRMKLLAPADVKDAVGKIVDSQIPVYQKRLLELLGLSQKTNREVVKQKLSGYFWEMSDSELDSWMSCLPQ